MSGRVACGLPPVNASRVFYGGVGGGLFSGMTRVILLLDVYVTVEGFVDIGYIAGVECIFGRARWLKTRRTQGFRRAPNPHPRLERWATRRRACFGVSCV